MNDGFDEAAISRAFRWAAEHGADIISCSWGPADGTGVKEPIPLIVKAAIDQALEKGRKGRGCVIFSGPPGLVQRLRQGHLRGRPSSGGRNGIWTTDVRGPGPQKRPIHPNLPPSTETRRTRKLKHDAHAAPDLPR